ncbi:hypothetical protein D0T60_17710 [Bacteroides sp. 224]|nr:hypothetical protein [Bacteroides sp. 224]
MVLHSLVFLPNTDGGLSGLQFYHYCLAFIRSISRRKAVVVGQRKKIAAVQANQKKQVNQNPGYSKKYFFGQVL